MCVMVGWVSELGFLVRMGCCMLRFWNLGSRQGFGFVLCLRISVYLCVCICACVCVFVVWSVSVFAWVVCGLPVVSWRTYMNLLFQPFFVFHFSFDFSRNSRALRSRETAFYEPRTTSHRPRTTSHQPRTISHSHEAHTTNHEAQAQPICGEWKMEGRAM